MGNELVERKDTSIFGGDIASFEAAQRMAKMLSESDFVPDKYKKQIGNCVIVLEISRRMGVSPLMIMQSMHVVHGKPGFSGQFIIALVNTSVRFSPLRFKFSADRQSCVAVSTDLATGEVIEGTAVSIAMAKAEGWYGKSGSKWQTMPELMLQYRAGAFFGRVNCPENLMGMRSVEEICDEQASRGNPKAWDIEIVPEIVQDAVDPLRAMAEEAAKTEETKPPRSYDEIVKTGVDLEGMEDAV